MNSATTKCNQRGMTLIELMIAMAIGLILLLGAVTVYTQGRQSYAANESVSRVQENLRFALAMLEPDIRLAGYWGMNNDISGVDFTNVNILCNGNGNDITNWVFDPLGNGADPVIATNNVQAAQANQIAGVCPVFAAGILANTDILQIRRVTGQPLNLLPAGEVLVQSNVAGATAFSNGAIPPAYTDVNPNEMGTYGVVLNAWYISGASELFPNTPSLRRLTLRNGQLVDEEVIAGVEDFQIQLGLDTDPGGDGNVDQYVDPDSPLVATNQVLSVRIWLLIRGTEAERGFIDGATYTPLDRVLLPVQPADNFRRIEVSKTIFLRNTRV